jgi:hypothetical protein
MFQDNLPIPTNTDQRWEIERHKEPAVTGDLNLYRFGNYHPHCHHKRCVPTVNPHNEHYSSVEMAKRKRDASDNEWWNRKKQQLHHEDIQKQKWIRPGSESFFQIHRPNIQNFNKPLSFRLPRY